MMAELGPDDMGGQTCPECGGFMQNEYCPKCDDQKDDWRIGEHHSGFDQLASDVISEASSLKSLIAAGILGASSAGAIKPPHYTPPKIHQQSIVQKPSIGIRLNNPGNVRYNPRETWLGQIGHEGGFIRFDSPQNGVRACARTFNTYFNTEAYKINTIRGMITRYAPPEDGNDTEGYIRFVSELTKIPADKPIRFSDLDTAVPIVQAVLRKETNTKWDRADVELQVIRAYRGSKELAKIEGPNPYARKL